ncbi:hypothetical protein AVEN_157296-1, partial [Araneus ventricosus]
YVKDKEYAFSVAKTEDLKTRTTHADSPTINTWIELEHRLDVVPSTKGADIEIW